MKPIETKKSNSILGFDDEEDEFDKGKDPYKPSSSLASTKMDSPSLLDAKKPGALSTPKSSFEPVKTLDPIKPKEVAKPSTTKSPYDFD